ncbi:MAG TPA: EI24 domain-containing protein [Burkholderiaceae bacterium]|nr:EI24 domain-containing protein [Burkholderiaceae bacterium]
MGLIFDSFWRAALYCLHPRVILLSLLPLGIMVALAFAAGYWYWEPAVAAVTAWLESNALLSVALGWLDSVGLAALRGVIGPLMVLFIATPVIVIIALLLVALMMTPAMVDLVAQRRFPKLEKKHGASWVVALLWSLLSTSMALLAMVASLPLWLIPPLIMVLPPLIWGWLTYRVFAFDVLAAHASADERKALFAQYRHQFLVLGIITGYLGALPSVLWASGAMFIAMAPLLIPLAIWVYALVFAFSSLWFAHFGLAALGKLREADALALARARDWAAPAPATPDAVTDIGEPTPVLPSQAALPAAVSNHEPNRT